jgi:hypothetical protein
MVVWWKSSLQDDDVMTYSMRRTEDVFIDRYVELDEE